MQSLNITHNILQEGLTAPVADYWSLSKVLSQETYSVYGILNGFKVSSVLLIILEAQKPILKPI